MADICPDDLYQQFIEVLHQRINDGGSSGIDRGEEGAFDKAKEFEDLTDSHLQLLMSFKFRRSHAKDENESKKLEVMLREERNTWRLAKALLKARLLRSQSANLNDANHLEHMTSNDSSRDFERMDDSSGLNSYDLGHDHPLQNGLNNHQRDGLDPYVRISEEQIIMNYFMSNDEIRRMQLVTDWLEANEASDLKYKDEEDKVEFYAEGPTAWENTFHSMRASYNVDIPDLDVTMNPNAGLELCNAMDPDAPIRTKKALAHQDKEIEIRLFKHLFRFIRAGQLEFGQELAQKVGYHWLSAILDGWMPYSDPYLDDENMTATDFDHEAITGNKKRDVWKQTCFKAAKMHGLGSFEKAILGVFGGNVKCVLPVCLTWSDQLWARLKCSIDVKIEKALRDPELMQQENRNLIDLPQDFYDNYQSLPHMFQAIRENQKIVSPFREATIHQTLQRHLILNDIDGLLNQLSEWCTSLDYDVTEGSVSPHFLRCFAHIVLFLREIDLTQEDDPRASKIIESYITYLTQQKSIESVAYYSGYLIKENQTYSFAKLLATIHDREERRQCLIVAKESRLDVDDITQTVVEIIRDEKPSIAFGCAPNDTRTTPFDKRKIDAFDYLLLLDTKNYIAILHHGNILLRHFALLRKMDAVKETFLKLPANLAKSVESQWRLHTNSDITPMLRNNIRELDSFRHLLEVQEELSQWSEWHHKKPDEPRKPANMTKFCDNVNYEQRQKQYQQDLNVWRDLREVRTNSLADKITQMFHFEGGWMKDLPTNANEQEAHHHAEMSSIYTVSGINTPSHKPSSINRPEQLNDLRKHFVPDMVLVCFNVLQLTQRYEECLKLSHLLAQEDLKLYEEFTKVQLRDFLSKISEITKLIVKKSLAEDEEHH